MDSRNLARFVNRWNTKLHIYVGLFSLLFLWLFAISGFVMNHPLWFSGQPVRSNVEQAVEVPAGVDDQTAAEALVAQLGLSGEVMLMVPKKDHLTFRVLRPTRRIVVDVDLTSSTAAVRTAIPPTAGVLTSLHTSTGIREIWREPNPKRDWLMTTIWSFCLDAVCVSLIFMVCSSLWMWVQIKGKRVWGGLALGLGTVTCAFFIWGLS